jgi:hypothetical protein
MARAAHDPVQAAARPPGPGRAGRERPTPGRADPGRAVARSGAGAPVLVRGDDPPDPPQSLARGEHPCGAPPVAEAGLVREDDAPPDLPESLARGEHPSRAPPVAGARRTQGGGPLENLA